MSYRVEILCDSLNCEEVESRGSGDGCVGMSPFDFRVALREDGWSGGSGEKAEDLCPVCTAKKASAK